MHQIPLVCACLHANFSEAWRPLANMTSQREPTQRTSSRTETTTESKFGTASKIRYGDKKTPRRLLRNAYFRQEASITGCDIFWPNFGQKMPKIISLHDVLEPSKLALWASRDVIISSQICGSKLQKVFPLGDGCLSVNSPALILSKNSGVFLAKIG